MLTFTLGHQGFREGGLTTGQDVLDRAQGRSFFLCGRIEDDGIPGSDLEDDFRKTAYGPSADE